jgi:RNA polymerase sigma-70 factor (ECF subfamily)
MSKREDTNRPCDSEELTKKAAEGDAEVLDELVHCFERSLLHFAERYCRDEEDARDVVQDAYLAATRYLPGFRGEASIKTWLTRLVISACSHRRRGARNDPRRHVNLEDLPPRKSRQLSSDPEAERKALTREVLASVQEAMSKLNQTDRAVLLLRDGKEMTSAETAAFLGISVPAVKSRLHRARKAIRESLGDRAA